MTSQTPSSALIDLADAYGVATEYTDWQGEHTTVSAESIRTILAALDVRLPEGDADAAARQALEALGDRSWRRTVPPFTLVRQGGSTRVPVHVPHLSPVEAWIELEDGARIDARQLQIWVDPRTVDGAELGEATFEVPADLPLGYHTFCARPEGGEVARGRLAVVPERIDLPVAVAQRGALGLMSQIYSVRSRRSWGVGDFADLADTTAWAAHDLSADFMLINPVHAAEYAGHLEPSPYLPTSRRFVNPLYIRVEDVPEVAYLDAATRARVEELGRGARAADTDDRIDRDAAWEAKKAALRLVFDAGRSTRRQVAFDDYREREGRALVDFATWCVLTAHVSDDEDGCPAELRHPESAQVEAFRAEHAAEVEFVTWLQWVANDQLGAVQREALGAGMSIGLMADLAVGVHPSGADAWRLGDALASGVTVGAPPDPYNQLGQDWSQPPWRPDRLEELGYEPFRAMIHAALRHAGGLRIDHVIGLFRLWWVPAGCKPLEGTYVRLDHEAMIGILCLEAQRAGAVIVGEDLGTVEPWVRDYLRERGVLGTSILWFERRDGGVPVPPEDYRCLCLASVTTHDLPPTAGYLTGEHIEVRDRLGLFTRPVEQEREEDEADRERMLTALADRGLLGDAQTAKAVLADVPGHLDVVVDALHRYLSDSPALLVGIAVPDLVGDRRTMNQPGTSDEYPNWRLPLADPDRRPVLLEDLVASDRARALVENVHRGDTA